jgi:hypothetical protein
MFKSFFYTDEKGIVLVVGLMFMALLSILAATAYVISTQDSFISENYKFAEQAFNHAEAGIQYGVVNLENAIKSGSSLPETGSMNIPGGDTPSDFSFTLSPLNVEGPNAYSFTSTGISHKNASAQIKAGIKRLPAIPNGVFGDLRISAKTHVQFFSYDSRVMRDPAPSYSTGNCDLASNGFIALDTGTFVDGNIILGNNRTVGASYHPTGAPVVTGDQGVYAGRIEPDPMNVNSEDFQREFDSAAITNDNADITPSISGVDIVNPGGNIAMPGKPGGSIYYLETMLLSESDRITIDAQNGPVKLYIRGPLAAKDDSVIHVLNSSEEKAVALKITEDPLNPMPANVIIVGLFNNSTMNKSGPPTVFTLMTDSDARLEIKDSSEFNGLIYAPHSEILLNSSKPIKGAILGKSIVCNDQSILYFDTALKDKYLSNDLSVVSWKKVLN